MSNVRTAPMIWQSNPPSMRPGGAAYCVACGRPIAGTSKWSVHVIGGGSVVLHPDDEDLYKAEWGEEGEPGEMGFHDIGSECRKKFGEFAQKVR